MAHTKPQPTLGRKRLRVYGTDTTTDNGTVVGANVVAHHSKDFNESSMSFSVSTAEAVLAGDETVLAKAFVQPEVDTGGGTYVAFGTPYYLAPGSTAVRDGSGWRRQSPVAVGALRALLDQCEVLPSECDKTSPTFKRAGGLERNRYMDFTSKHYSFTLHTWNDADVYATAGQKKANKPEGWDDADAEYVFRDAEEGGRTCFVFRNVADDAYYFTLTERRRVVIVWTSDENGKVFLDGPNQGGCIIDWTADEDGYNQGFGRWTGHLEAGDYRISAWMLTLNSAGGDGNDSARLSAWTVATDGSGDRDAYLMRSDANTQVLRQDVDAELPGMSPGETIRRLLAECADVAGADNNAAQLLLDNRTFTDLLDTEGNAWTSFIGYVWPLGTSLASAVGDMLGEISADMGPGFTFDAWQTRSVDVSASVDLVGGAAPPTAVMNIGSYGAESDPAGPNALLGESQEGLLLVAPSIGAGEWRRFGQAELGGSSNAGRTKNLLQKQIQDFGDERRYYQAEILPVAGATPYDDFGVEYVIHGRGYRDLGLDVEVTAIGWRSGTVKFSLDLGVQ